ALPGRARAPRARRPVPAPARGAPARARARRGGRARPGARAPGREREGARPGVRSGGTKDWNTEDTEDHGGHGSRSADLPSFFVSVYRGSEGAPFDFGASDATNASG